MKDEIIVSDVVCVGLGNRVGDVVIMTGCMMTLLLRIPHRSYPAGGRLSVSARVLYSWQKNGPPLAPGQLKPVPTTHSC